MKALNISWWIIGSLLFQVSIFKVKGYPQEKDGDYSSINKESEIDNLDYLKSLKGEELYDTNHIYNNTYQNPIYYLNQVNKFVKRGIKTNYGGDEDTRNNELFLFGNQLDGFSLFVYETLIDIAFSATRGIKLSSFYYYNVNFFDLVQDTDINALISTGYSAL